MPPTSEVAHYNLSNWLLKASESSTQKSSSSWTKSSQHQVISSPLKCTNVGSLHLADAPHIGPLNHPNETPSYPPHIMQDNGWMLANLAATVHILRKQKFCRCLACVVHKPYAQWEALLNRFFVFTSISYSAFSALMTCSWRQLVLVSWVIQPLA